MKKLYILCALGLGMSLAACDEVESYVENPQVNPQEAPFDMANVVVTPAAGPFSLAEYDNLNQPIQLATASADDPTGYGVRLAVQIAKSEDFDKPFALESTESAEGGVLVEADAIQDFYYNNVTHDPAEGTVYLRYAAYAVKDKTAVRLGGPDFYYGPYALNVLPFGPTKVIEDSYSIVVDGETFAFGHSDASPYDDPKFSVVVNATEGATWKIVSATGNVYGPAGATDESGDLLYEAPEGKFGFNGPAMFEIDMLTDTYSYKLAYECFYTPGGSNGWTGSASQKLTTTDYTTYTGLIVVGDYGFKINPDTDWTGKDVGLSQDLEEVAPGVYTGTVDGGNNIEPAVKGLYYVEYTPGTKAVKLSYISTLGAIGDFNGWGESLVLTPSADMLTWTSAPVEISEGQTFKLRANDAWDLDWGGSLDNVVFKGPNIYVEETATYIITFDIASSPNTLILTKQ